MKCLLKPIVKSLSLSLCLLLSSCGGTMSMSSEDSSINGSVSESGDLSNESSNPESDVVSNLLSLTNATIKSDIVTTHIGSFTDSGFYEKVHYKWISNETRTLKLDEGDIESSYLSNSSDYEISYTNLCRALKLTNPTKSQITQLLADNRNRFCYSKNDTYSWNLDKDNDLFALNVIHKSSPSYTYASFDKKEQRYVYLPKQKTHQATIMLDSNFDYRYSLNKFKPLYIDAIKYGVYNQSNNTFTFNPEKPYFLNNGYSHFVAYSLTMKVNDDLPVKITIEGFEDGTDVVITQSVSKIGKTTLPNYEYEIEEHNHDYSFVEYEYIDNEHCRPYCATCKRYLDDVHEHVYQNNEEICVFCQHIKNEEIYHYDDFEKALNLSTSGLVKSSSGKIFIDTEYNVIGDMFPGFGQGNTIYSDQSWHYDKEYIHSSILYYSEKNVLVVVHTYPSTKADNSCISYSKRIAYLYTNFNIDSDNQGDIYYAVYQLAKADTTVKYMLDNYTNIVYKSSLEYYRHDQDHDCYGDHTDTIRNYEIIEIDDCHTLHKSVCKNCSRCIFNSLIEHHTVEYTIIDKPSNFDEDGYIPYFDFLSYFTIECSKCGYKPDYSLIVGSRVECGLEHWDNDIYTTGYYNDTDEELYIDNYNFIENHIFEDDKCLICGAVKLESSDLDDAYLVFDYCVLSDEYNLHCLAQFVSNDNVVLFTDGYHNTDSFYAYGDKNEYVLEGDITNDQIDITLIHKGDSIAEFTYYIC